MTPTEPLTKVCTTCYGEIDARARKCPHCHSLLGSQRTVLILLGTLGLMLFIAVIGGMIWRDFYMYSRAAAPDHSGEVEIVQSQLFLATGPNAATPGPNAQSAVVVGLLRNNSTATLNGIHFEVRVFDSNNVLVDSLPGYHGEIVRPGEVVSFKVGDRCNIHQPESRYLSHKVFVRGAK